MAGLLGDGWDSPQSQGLLALAAGMIQGNFGKGVADYGTTMAGAQEREMRRKFEQMRMEQAQEEMLLNRQEREGKAYDSAAIRRSFSPIQGGQAMQDGQGPTLGNAANLGKMPKFSPQQFFADNPSASPAALKQAMELNQSFNPAKKYESYAPDSSVFEMTPDGPKLALTTPGKPDKPPVSVQEFNYSQANPAFDQWLLKGKQASAPKSYVDLRDPTAVAKAAMGFQNDYRAATKDSYSRMQAYQSMVEASKDPSAKGDLTMVYSFIKALDPTSVVREGEISLVNANRSIPDQVKGYAQKLATGQNLLPEERQDLIRQAQTLTQTDYTRSRNDVSAYKDNAKRLGLDPNLYAPDPYAGFVPNDGKKPNAGSSGKLSIVAPNGKTYNFNNERELANWKMATGVK